MTEKRGEKTEISKTLSLARHTEFSKSGMPIILIVSAVRRV